GWCPIKDSAKWIDECPGWGISVQSVTQVEGRTIRIMAVQLEGERFTRLDKLILNRVQIGRLIVAREEHLHDRSTRQLRVITVGQLQIDEIQSGLCIYIRLPVQRCFAGRGIHSAEGKPSWILGCQGELDISQYAMRKDRLQGDVERLARGKHSQ